MSRLGNLRNLSSAELEDVSSVLDEKLSKIRQMITNFQLDSTNLSYDEFQKRLAELKTEHDRQLKSCCSLFEEKARRKTDVRTDRDDSDDYDSYDDVLQATTREKRKEADGFVVKGAKLKVPNGLTSVGKESAKRSEAAREKITKMWQDFDLSEYVTELRNTERLEREELERRRLEHVVATERRKQNVAKKRVQSRTKSTEVSERASNLHYEDDEDNGGNGAVLSDTEFETARSRLDEAQKSASEQQKHKSRGALSDDEGAAGWRHKLTVPQPFSMTKREEAAGGYRSKATRSMQRTLADLDAKRAAEERELATQFRANPPPASIYVPLLATMSAKERDRREKVRKSRAQLLQSMERPFSFTKRDAYRRELRREHEHRHTSCRDDPETIHRPVFNARPPPTFIYDDVAQRRRQEELARAYRLQIRAEQLLRSSSLPHSMAIRAQSRHLTIGNTPDRAVKVTTEGLGLGQAFQPQITKGVPNFDEMHRRFAQELERRKQSHELTKPQPFSFCAEDRLDRRGTRRREASSEEEHAPSPSPNKAESRNAHSRTSSLTEQQRRDLKEYSKKERALRKTYLNQLERLRGKAKRDDEDAEFSHNHVPAQTRNDEATIRRHAWQSYKEALQSAGLHGEPTKKRTPRPRAAYERDSRPISSVNATRANRTEADLDLDLDSDEFFSDDGDEKWENLKYM